MSRLFSLDHLQKLRVPSTESFSLVLDAARDTLSREEWVVCAGVFGSVARGDHTVQSDLDCLVVYQLSKEQQAMQVMTSLAKLAAVQNVPLQFVCCDNEIARTGLHSLQPQFVAHIKQAFRRGGRIAGSLGYLKVADALQSETVSFVAHRYNGALKFSARLGSHSEEEYLRGLSACYDSVTRVARKVLADEGRLAGDDSKRTLVQLYRHVDSVLWDVMCSVSDLEYGFQRLVEQVIAGQPLDHGMYRYVIRSLEEGLPLVRGFLRGNLLYLHRRQAV